MRSFVTMCASVVLCAASVGFGFAQDRPNPDRPNPERAARFENAMREMNQRANELRGAIREAKESGRERVAEENTKALHELEMQMANTRREFGGDRPQPQREGGDRPQPQQQPQPPRGEAMLRELNARVEHLSSELATARENKREDAVRELTQAIEKTERERNTLRQRLENAPRGGGDRPQPQRDPQPQRGAPQPPRGGDIGPDAVRELMTTVRQLRAEVENLRKEVENLKRERK